MSTLLKTRGRPTGGKNLAFVSVSQLREKLTDAAKIPVSIKFAKLMDLVDEGEPLPQTPTPFNRTSPAKEEKPVVIFSISDKF
jgi:hypothetical protein